MGSGEGSDTQNRARSGGGGGGRAGGINARRSQEIEADGLEPLIGARTPASKAERKYRFGSFPRCQDTK